MADMTAQQKLDILIAGIKAQESEFDDMTRENDGEAKLAKDGGNDAAADIFDGKATAYDFASQMMRDLLKTIGEF